MKISRANVITAMFLVLVAPEAAWAEGEVELKAVAEQEVRVVGPDGREEAKRKAASKVIPGDEVIYTISARNRSPHPVEGVVINDPIPQHMTYVMGSASDEDTEVTFSVDGGKTFGKHGQLTVVDDTGAARKAEGGDYTDIRWVLSKPLSPAESQSVSFRARLD